MKTPGMLRRSIRTPRCTIEQFIKKSNVIALAAATLAFFTTGARGASIPAQSVINYEVPPLRISPDHGQLIADNPFFREPQLLWTDKGLITAFMEIPADDTAHRAGWACTSPTGTKWLCSAVSRGPGGTDFADAWLTDSRGDPCPTYGKGITMAALRASASATLEPIAYYSLDFGKTWVGPEILPYPNSIELPLADGSKTLYTGRDYISWRDFTFLTGEYISQLQTVGGTCSWGTPIRLTTVTGKDGATLGYDDGSDHPRLAATPVSGELAARGSFGDQLLTFHRYDSSQNQEYESIIGEAGYPEDALLICPSTSQCAYELLELGTTLLWVPISHTYVAVYSAYDTGGSNPESVGLWYKTSTDEGNSWSAGVQLAGPSIDQSYIVMEETLAYDTATGDTLLAYYEVPQQSSYATNLQLRVLHPDATQWTPAQTIRTLSWQSHGSEKRFGDYFGLQANNGVAHVAEGNYDTVKQTGYIEYFSLRYPR